MPRAPTRDDLGQIRFSGRTTPASINPNVAYDIGRAGAAQAAAWRSIAAAFSGLASKSQAMDDQAWLAQAKLDTLQADADIRRQTALSAGPDGAGFEAAPTQLKSTIEQIEARPGGSPEARSRYKIWSAEQAFKTGQWATDTAQGRLQSHTLGRLDSRLDSLETLVGSNPGKTQDYFAAYREEVMSYVGTAITAVDAEQRIDQARSRIVKAGVIAKGQANPIDFAKALKALELTRPQTRPDDGSAAQAEVSALSGGKPVTRFSAGVNSALNKAAKTAGINPQWLEAFTSIESSGRPGLRSSGGKGSYHGLLQLSKKEFKKYGGTGNIYDAEQNAMAGAKKLKAEIAEFKDKVGRAPTPTDLYLYHQQGPAGYPAHLKNPDGVAWKNIRPFYTDKAAKQKGFRDGDAYAKAAIWHNVPTDVRGNYPGGVEKMTSRQFIDLWRKKVSRRMGAAAGAPAVTPKSEAERRGIDVDNLPKVDGTIQPAELLILKPEDFNRVTRELRPALAQQLTKRMENAVAAIAAKGSQTIITPEEIDDASPIIGVKAAEQWKTTLDEAEQAYLVQSMARNMTPAARQQMLRDLVPSGGPEALAADEQRRFQMWASAIKAINKQIADDPLGYLTTYNESGRQAMKQISEAPEGEDGKAQRELAYDTLLELQKRENVPVDSRRVLSEGQATQIVGQLREADTGPRAVGVLGGLRQHFGSHFNQIWGELVQAGGPSEYRALPTATLEGQNALVEAFALEKAMSDATGKGSSRKDLLRERAGVDRKDFAQAITNELAEHTSAIRGSGLYSNQAIEAYRSAVGRVALYSMVVQGKNLNDAVSYATDQIIRKNVKAYRGVLIPSNIYEQHGTAIELGLTSKSAQLVDSGIGDGEFIVSSGLSSRRYGPDYTHRKYIAALRTQHSFSTNEEMTGVYLHDQFGEPVMQDADPEPVFVFFTWDEIRKAGEIPSSRYQKDQPAPFDFGLSDWNPF